MTRATIEPANPPRIAVAIPCHNESHTVGQLIASFSANLPQVHVLVLDNASTDDTARVAREAGATVQAIPQLGKGAAVRAGFETLDADMVVGERLSRARRRAFKPLRHGGNRVITFVVGLLFGHRYKDVLSGYRAVTREFARAARLQAEGFEIEIEMLAAARRLGSRVVEVPVGYEARHPLSSSKLVPLDDAILILRTAWKLRPRGRD